jgi:histidyl-tRNA synthetase
MSTFSALPGFRDFYPEDFAVRAHIVAAWREVSRRYGYVEYDGPPLEPLELYTEKSGQEIVHQLYAFQDKGGRSVALRPEMTPTLARMVGARAGALSKPVRWYSIPQLFRYERAQRGRLREHFQWNVDLIGEEDVPADAEVLAMALDSLRQLGLAAGDVVARVSDRRLLERLLLNAGVQADQLAAAYAVIDKLGREPASRTRERLQADAGLGTLATDEVFRIFEQRDLPALARAYAGVPGVTAELDRLDRYLGELDALGFRDFIAFDPRVVRGLAYYTGIVFEVFDRKGELRAICGGGRYDRLLAQLGGADLPALGFGMGDVVLRELLADRGLLPRHAPRLDYYVVTITDGERTLARELAGRLRAAGHAVSYALRGAGVGRQFKEANARGAERAIVLGPDEVRAGEAVVRVMASGEETRVALESFPGG